MIKKVRMYVITSQTHVIQFRLKIQQRSELLLFKSLVSLSIMVAQLRAPLEAPVHHSTVVFRGLRGAI